MNTNLKQKNDFDCNFSNSHFCSLRNNFLYLYPYIIPPLHSQIFSVQAKLFDLVARSSENLKFLGDSLFCVDLISFFGRGEARLFSSIKPSMTTNHVNSRIVDNKIICFMCMLTFLIFTNAPKVWLVFDMNSEKACTIIWQWLTKTVNIVWYQIWKSD